MERNTLKTQYRSLLEHAATLTLSLLLTCTIAIPVSLFNPSVAQAITTETDAEPDATQQEIERTSAAYEKANARATELDNQISQNTARIEELENSLPQQQARGDNAMRMLYKLQQDANSFINLILGTENLNDFLTTVEYVDHLQQRNFDTLANIKAMKKELETSKVQLDADKAEVDEEKAYAEEALRAAQVAREEAQRRALEEARAQAAAEQAAQDAAAAEAARAAEEAKKAESTPQQPENPAPPSQGSSGDIVPPTSDGADWSTDKTAFVNEWQPRIDAYLAGSPLAGQGETFAVAAWTYGVDPRWSPAISNTESSKGRHCFKPHNAWGWGSSSWNSWEEAIDAHVRGLARGYGYTISISNAKKYCPPNWEHWYNKTSEQMNSI